MIGLSQSVSVGPVAMSVAQLLIALAGMMALLTAWLLARRHRVSVVDPVFNLFLVIFLAARIAFVLRYWGDYNTLWSIIDIRDRGFDPITGALAGTAFFIWQLYRHKAARTALSGAVAAGMISASVLLGGVWLMESTSRAMPESPLITLDGNPTSLPAIQNDTGQPLVVNLWATWCPPCRREMPVLEEAQKQHPEITFVYANQREHEELIQHFLDEESLSLDNTVLDAGGNLAQQTGSMGLPTTLYYNAEGQLVDVHFGELSRATLQRGLQRLDP